VRRLLPDQGLAPRTAAILREREFDAIHVSEIGMDRSDDVAILLRAASEQRVCVTLDHDFHAHLAMTSRGNPSVILLREQMVDAQGQADLSQLKYARCETALPAGAAVSANHATTRVRRLPLKWRRTKQRSRECRRNGVRMSTVAPSEELVEEHWRQLAAVPWCPEPARSAG
jgi:predicted nuclease of predicted toxin-antitoxin system